MPLALVVNADVGSGPAICEALTRDGWEVATLEAGAVGRRTIGEAVRTVARDGLGLLVNNVLWPGARPVLETPPAVFAQALDEGLHSVFSACREAARAAAERSLPLTIVNVVSVLAQVGLAGRAAEACVSAGVVAMTRALAAEWGPIGVRVLAVQAGPAASWTPGSTSIEDVPGVIPLGRLVEDADVASAVVVAAASDLGAMTGQSIVIDAGWLAHGWRRERA